MVKGIGEKGKTLRPWGIPRPGAGTIQGTRSLSRRKGPCPRSSRHLGISRGAGGHGRLLRYMLMEIDRPPLPKRGLTTLLRVEPKEKLKPTENE